MRSVPGIKYDKLFPNQNKNILVFFLFFTFSKAQFGFLDGILQLFLPSSFEPSEGPGGCSAGGNDANHQFGGQHFIISWRLGCSQFTQASAERFCRQNNMKYDGTLSVRGERELTSFNFPDQSVSTAPPNSESSWVSSRARTRDFSGLVAGWGDDLSSGPQDDLSTVWTGATRAGPAVLSPTTERGTRTVWPCWTISTRTESSSTTSPVATGSQSSARPEQAGAVCCYCWNISDVFIWN